MRFRSLSCRARRVLRGAVISACLAGTSRVAVAQSVAHDFVVLDSTARRSADAPLSTPVTLAMTDARRRDVISSIGAQARVSIVLDPALPGLGERVSQRLTRVPAATALVRVLAGSGVSAMVSPSGEQVVLVARASAGRAAGRVGGSVQSAEGPVAGAHVELEGTRYRATTHDDGGFVLDGVPDGDYTLRVVRLGFRVLAEPLHLAAGDDAHVRLTMAREVVALQEVVVTPGYYGLIEGSGSAPQSMSREQLETIPQIGEDIYRAINRLPGVAASDFSARFSVRGAAADQLYVTLDGLRLLEPFHLKDIGSGLSIIDIQTLGQASLVSGGASAAYGDNVGGVFEMRSLDPRAEPSRSSAGASLTNLRATSQGSFASGRGGWLVSGRRGFLDLVFRVTSLGDSIRPRYDDVFAKVQYSLPHGGELAVHGLHSGDDLNYIGGFQEQIVSRYLADYLWMTLRQPIGARWHSETVLSAGGQDWRRGGMSGVSGGRSATIDDRRKLTSLEARQDWSVLAARYSLLSVGIDVRHEDVRYDYTRAGTNIVVGPDGLGTVPESLRVLVAPRGNTVGLYATHRLQPAEALTIETGVRLDRPAATGEHLVSPRAAVAWQVRPGTTLRGSWGRYAQAQPLFALMVPDGDTTFSPADRSEQSELALEQSLPRGLKARVNAYHRELTYERRQSLNTSSAMTPFPEVEYDRIVVPATSGRARGVEVGLGRVPGDAVEWSASYAAATATDDIAGRAVPHATDQRHTVYADWSYHPASNRWRIALGGTWHSGMPTTPEVVTIDTLVNTPTRLSLYSSWKPGALNSDRLPAYHRLDIRWTRYFPTSRGRMSVFGELYNALNHTNVRGYYTNVTVNGRTVRLVQGSREQLPRIPSAGFSWEF